MKSQKLWLSILTLFLGIQIYVLFFKKTKIELAPEKLEIPTETNLDKIQQRMQGGHLVESQGGKRDWELLSDVSISYQGRADWDLEGVEIRFYNSELQDLVVKGEKGNIDMATKNMRIEGHVRIETSNGYVFLAPYIEYVASTRLISCVEQVRVMGPLREGKRTLSLNARGIQIPVNERKMKLLNDVRGSQTLESGNIIKVMSDQAELSAQTQTAQFDGRVKLENGEQILRSQKAIFAYEETSKKFDFLEMRGGVELSQGSRRVVSEDLKIDFATQKLTFSGQPRLYQDEDELSGDKIIFLDGGKRVKVEKVKAKGVTTP